MDTSRGFMAHQGDNSLTNQAPLPDHGLGLYDFPRVRKSTAPGCGGRCLAVRCHLVSDTLLSAPTTPCHCV